MRLRPRILIDVKNKKDSVFSKKKLKLNLCETRIIRIPVFKFLKASVLIMAGFYLVFGSVSAPVGSDQLSLAAQSKQEEQRLLEEEYELVLLEINEKQKILNEIAGQGKNLESEVRRLNTQIASLNLKLKATTLSLKRLDNEIEDTQNNIEQTESDTQKSKRVLSGVLQNLYLSENTNLVEIFLKNPELGDFFSDVKSLTDIQNNLRITLEKVIILKQELINEKEELVLQKGDIDDLIAYQANQKQGLSNTKVEKNDLLEITKGEESKYQKLLIETQKRADEIRSRIFKLFGGGELRFDEAVKIAQLAEQSTGIRPAFILAILTQESAINGVIGANLGQCYYDDPRNNPSGTVMKDSQKGAFLSILSTIKNTSLYTPSTAPVSCPILRDGAYGGAMGPSQFMPTTWAYYGGYEINTWKYRSSKDYVAKITGNYPSSPWNNADAFVATALYLKNAYNSSGCIDYSERNKYIFSKQYLLETCTAAKYYAGGNWYSHRLGYGQAVANRAVRFQEEIDILMANN
jgi:peptidoglycan hydrolase CwlO-like protein